ncbi:cell death abnormality protein 1-like [Pomacea canaliculata]|uniref:cell death abnormality protein 1-like n=1 Tax=Pomacea canaliculata TaxID=400727 RepID=UPI000D73F047|nr:cell death abnormality protein 1-like [Pomacea canaliculata]
MNFLVLTTIITLQTFVTAQGAEKLLNEACDSTDTCVDISGTNIELTCDVIAKRCLIKVGKTCDGTQNLCVNGAFCQGSPKVCSCGTDYTAASGLCGPTGRQPGADCKSGTTTCIANAACTEGVCACNDGHNLVEAGTCDAAGANTIGGSCTATSENTKGSCTDTNAVCSATSSGKCVCKDGYVGIVGGGCSIMPNRVGGLCKTDTAGNKGTCGDKAVCSTTTNGVCQCPRGHKGNDGDTGCNVMPNKLGGSCTTNTAASRGSCDGDGLCSATPNGVCECPQGYQGQDGDTVCILQNNGGAAGVSMWLLVYMLVAGLCLTVFVV